MTDEEIDEEWTALVMRYRMAVGNTAFVAKLMDPNEFNRRVALNELRSVVEKREQLAYPKHNESLTGE